MLRRVVDLSLTVYPSIPSHTDYPPIFEDWETIGPERPRRRMHGLCLVRPFTMDRAPSDIMMDVTMGHSGPHSHCDVFKHDWLTLTHGVDPTERWTMRDACHVPARHFVGPGAVIDLSDIDDDRDVDVAELQRRATHVKLRDIIILRTDHPQKLARGHKKVPRITVDAARWLVEDKRVACFVSDPVGNGSFKKWQHVERVFYRNGALMVDDVINLDRITSKRVFVDCGMVTKFQGVDDSPARIVVVDEHEDLARGQLIDVFQPMKHTGPKPTPPFGRTEPLALKGDIMKRYKVRGFHYYMSDEYGSQIPRDEDIGWVPFKRFSNRIGTHIELPYAGTTPEPLPPSVCVDALSIPSSRLRGMAVVIDAPVGARQNVTEEHLSKAGGDIAAGDIVIVRTEFAENYYYRPDFLDYTPGFTNRALEWLVAKGVKMLITDTASVEENGWENVTARAGHTILFRAGIPVVLCAGNLWSLQRPKVLALCSPLPLEGLNASPVRLVAVEEYQ